MSCTDKTFASFLRPCPIQSCPCAGPNTFSAKTVFPGTSPKPIPILFSLSTWTLDVCALQSKLDGNGLERNVVQTKRWALTSNRRGFSWWGCLSTVLWTVTEVTAELQARLCETLWWQLQVEVLAWTSQFSWSLRKMVCHWIHYLYLGDASVWTWLLDYAGANLESKSCSLFAMKSEL